MHSDLNNFYASVERMLNPELAGKPVAVCGNEEERRGIVLAKSEEAKRKGIKTGDTVWQAKRKCPDLIVVRPHFDKYMSMSRKVKAIYAEYTDLIESYGIDECWLDVTHSTKVFPAYDGEKYVEVGGEKHFSDGFLRHIGDTIRLAVKRQTGVTVSVGVSFNKIYAKLGSDLKKPDGTTVISLLNYKNMIFGLPVSDLLMVGGATAAKLTAMGYNTIGKLAAADDNKVVGALGKFGQTLLTYARGEDETEVRALGDDRELKSIGNSMTCPRDLTTYDDVKRTLFVLSESVAARLREQGCVCGTVTVGIRTSDLTSFDRQRKLPVSTDSTLTIWEATVDIFRHSYTNGRPVRSLSVKASGLSPADGMTQLSLFPEERKAQRRADIDRAIDKIRAKYGYFSIRRAITLIDPALDLDARGDHIIYPVGFLGTL